MTIEEVKAKQDELDARITKAEEAQKSFETAKENLLTMGGARGGDSDEKRALRYFGAKDASQLVRCNTEHPRFTNVPPELKFLVRELKKDLDVSRMIQQIFHGQPKDSADRTAHVKGVLDNPYGKDVLAPKLKAFGTGVAGEGAEWVPTATSSQFIEEFELDRGVVKLFQQVNMPTNPFDLPVQKDVTTARRQAEGDTSLAAANFGTDKIRLDAEKLTEFIKLPEELNEDSAPQILALSRGEVIEAQGRAYETLILNADDTDQTTPTHMDADVTSTLDARLVSKGLRKLALDNSANGATVDFLGAAVATAKLRAMRTAMGKFGVNVRDLAWCVSSKVYQQFLALPEVTTVEKFGPMATILKGALAALDGIPIVITEYNRDDLDATGVNSAPTDALSEVKLVNVRRFMWGVRRPIRVRALMNPTPPADEWLLASWSRVDFKGHAQSAAEVSVVLGINVL